MAEQAPGVERDTHVSGKHRVVNGRYLLETELGRGGMGTVFRALQLGVGNTVAIKFLNPLLSSDPSLVRRFEQEARATLAVTHPGAAQLLDTGRDEKTNELFIVFEYVAGEDLRVRLTQEGPLPFHEAREIALRVGEVLAVAHEKGLVHRDIKPENIRLRRDLAGTHVKVLDFGIAKFRAAADARLTADGAIAGTPAYMAPEQVRAEAVDARADLYALGVVLFEMIAGTHPFPSTSPSSLLVDHLTTPLPTLQARAPGRPFPELDAVLQRCCAKDPANRFQSAQELVAALKGLPTPPWAAPGVPEVPRPRTVPPPPPPAAPSKATGVAAGLVVLALLGSGFALVVWEGWKRLGARPPGAPGPSVCPGDERYRAELRGASTAELEQRVLRTRVVPPSLAARQLDSLKASSRKEGLGTQACVYRAMLLGAVAAEDTTLQTTPELWGHTREAEELELLLLEMPLQKKWTVAQRQDIVNQVTERVSTEAPGDREHWRRQYLGLELTCEATDEVLEQLKARRPASCLELSPRN